jgi:hypothetical protein
MKVRFFSHKLQEIPAIVLVNAGFVFSRMTGRGELFELSRTSWRRFRKKPCFTELMYIKKKRYSFSEIVTRSSFLRVTIYHYYPLFRCGLLAKARFFFKAYLPITICFV